jgi:DNA polymerase
MNDITKLIIESLLMQKEIFGDDLFIPKNELYAIIENQISIQKTKATIKSENLLETDNKNTLEQKKLLNDIKINKNEVKTVSKEISKTLNLKAVDILNNAINSQKEFENIKTLDEFFKQICNCQKCPLGKTRTNFVFGEGNPNADIMIIGEGPGAEEDAQGRPFVGKAGQLLDKIIESIKFKREEVYIANIVKCRPPGNRIPQAEEVDKCLPYLIKQIEIVNPKLILCAGLTAATYLVPQKATLSSLRGKFWDFMDKKVLVTYHPAALLRNPALKKQTWEDVKLFRKYYDHNILKTKSIFD